MEKYHNVGTIPKCNQKIVETGNINILNLYNDFICRMFLKASKWKDFFFHNVEFIDSLFY